MDRYCKCGRVIFGLTTECSDCYQRNIRYSTGMGRLMPEPEIGALRGQSVNDTVTPESKLCPFCRTTIMEFHPESGNWVCPFCKWCEPS